MSRGEKVVIGMAVTQGSLSTVKTDTKAFVENVKYMKILK